MTVKIVIENLRHIRRLEFSIPNDGVWLLTGANGTGKTSLLACMRRIGFGNAFPTHFPSSRMSDSLDSYQDSAVKYEINGSEVTYRHRGERWVPFPKANSRLLSQAGYPAVRYIAADAARIEPRGEDFELRRIRPAHQEIISAANTIFDTTKFNTLKTINLSTGIGNDAFLLEVPPPHGQRRGQARYISEKNFSLGELCILKLLRLLRDCPRGSLVLIDEIELALHPMAQVQLLTFLDEISRNRALTIIVSTHSATLIKHARPSRLLLLQQDASGGITCQQRCFPSLVLGALAYREETAADVIIYVEDEAAQILIEQFVLRFSQQTYQENRLAPSVQVIPVGGITNVLRFFVRQRRLLPAITRSYVLLDADAEQSLADARAEDIVRIRDSERQWISYLPITPEVGLAEFLHSSTTDIRNLLREHYRLQISFTRRNFDPLPAMENRDACKQLVLQACEYISDQLPNVRSLEVKVVLLRFLANHIFETDQASIMRLIGPIVRG